MSPHSISFASISAPACRVLLRLRAGKSGILPAHFRDEGLPKLGVMLQQSAQHGDLSGLDAQLPRHRAHQPGHLDGIVPDDFQSDRVALSRRLLHQGRQRRDPALVAAVGVGNDLLLIVQFHLLGQQPGQQGFLAPAVPCAGNCRQSVPAQSVAAALVSDQMSPAAGTGILPRPVLSEADGAGARNQGDAASPDNAPFRAIT